MAPPRTPTTRLCQHSLTSIHYGERDLVQEILGQRTFVDVMFEQVMGRPCSAVDRQVVDAVLIVLMEHGLTPSAIATRLVYMSAPENLQGAVASGLMAVGSQFVGTMENCARLLAEIMEAEEGLDAAADRVARRLKAERQAVPGFGHHLHKPDDPRALKLIEIGHALDLPGRHIAALEALAGAVDRAAGRHITLNATGAVAALLGEIGVPWQLMRGFAVVSRAAGLVAHVAEEQREPSGRFIWDLVDKAIPHA
ncbi:citryl-CoA lyase [Allostella vacuolata]|nr:citryl-CoA lyase [Stella vacuolata]